MTQIDSAYTGDLRVWRLNHDEEAFWHVAPSAARACELHNDGCYSIEVPHKREHDFELVPPGEELRLLGDATLDEMVLPSTANSGVRYKAVPSGVLMVGTAAQFAIEALEGFLCTTLE